MGRQYGHATKGGKVVTTKLPKGSTEEPKTVKSLGIRDSIRFLRGR